MIWVASLLLQLVELKAHLPERCLSWLSPLVIFFFRLSIPLSCFLWILWIILWLCQISRIFWDSWQSKIAQSYQTFFLLNALPSLKISRSIFSKNKKTKKQKKKPVLLVPLWYSLCSLGKSHRLTIIKSPQVSRTLLCILADLNNALVSMVSTRPLISKSSSLLTNLLLIVLSAPITNGITVTFMFLNFFSSLALLLLLSLFYSLWESFTLESEWQQVSSSFQEPSQYSGRSQQCCWLDGLYSFSYLQGLPSLYQSFGDCTECASKVNNFASSIFLLIIIRSGLLAEVWWPVCMSKSHRSFCVSFFTTDAGLCIYHLFVSLNLNFLHISQWIILPTQLWLVLYSFCANLLHSLIV